MHLVCNSLCSLNFVSGITIVTVVCVPCIALFHVDKHTSPKWINYTEVKGQLYIVCTNDRVSGHKINYCLVPRFSFLL